MKDNDKEHNLFDMVEGAIDFYEENKDMFKSLAPDEDKVRIDGKSPLKSAQVDDDMVHVTIEVSTEGIGEIRMEETEDGIIIGMGGERIMAEVPDDVNTDEASASLNNGVLDVQIPREGGDE